MNVPTRVLVIAGAFALLLPTCGFAPDAAQAPSVDVIVTEAPSYAPLAALRGEERFAKGAQLRILHQGKAETLVAGFAATADAQVSYDASKVLFAGKQNAADPWQIFELTIVDHTVRKIAGGAEDCIRPLYLPLGKIVYARRTARGFQLERAEADGSKAQQLSFLPASALPVDVLKDGRIVFESNYPMGTNGKPELYLMYSDGSGVESYRCDHATAAAQGRWGGKQLANGDVVFTHGSSLARFTSPLATEERVAAPRAEYAGSLAETPEGAWILSERASSSGHYALKLWQPGAAALQTYYVANDQDVVEPVLVAEHKRPNMHPSALHDWNYANLLALDARESREGNLKDAPKQVRLETMDADGKTKIAGVAPVEPDGSFFVKVSADKPIRFALLDEKGAVVRQEHGWFWIRAGEQRYCVGCHTGPERAPENQVPAVLLRTTTPVDLTGSSKENTEMKTSPEGK